MPYSLPVSPVHAAAGGARWHHGVWPRYTASRGVCPTWPGRRAGPRRRGDHRPVTGVKRRWRWQALQGTNRPWLHMARPQARVHDIGCAAGFPAFPPQPRYNRDPECTASRMSAGIDDATRASSCHGPASTPALTGAEAMAHRVLRGEPLSTGKRSQGYHGGTNLAQVGKKADRANVAVRASVLTGHRITSSAWKRIVGGMVRPSTLAVLRLMTSANRMGCSTGRSAGFAPLRMRST